VFNQNAAYILDSVEQNKWCLSPGCVNGMMGSRFVHGSLEADPYSINEWDNMREV